jgi:hypothetical protein
MDFVAVDKIMKIQGSVKIGLLSKLFREKEAVFIDGGGDFDQEIVGESHYQKHLKKLFGDHKKEGNRKEVIAKLHYENNNPHDKKAIRVDINGKTAGYLPREDAKFYRKQIEKTGHDGIIVSCNAVIVGGRKVGIFRKAHFGVWLDLPLEEL